MQKAEKHPHGGHYALGLFYAVFVCVVEHELTQRADALVLRVAANALYQGRDRLTIAIERDFAGPALRPHPFRKLLEEGWE